MKGSTGKKMLCLTHCSCKQHIWSIIRKFPDSYFHTIELASGEKLVCFVSKKRKILCSKAISNMHFLLFSPFCMWMKRYMRSLVIVVPSRNYQCVMLGYVLSYFMFKKMLNKLNLTQKIIPINDIERNS